MKQKQPRTLAAKASRYDLYQQSVQEPEADFRLIDRVFRQPLRPSGALVPGGLLRHRADRVPLGGAPRREPGLGDRSRSRAARLGARAQPDEPAAGPGRAREADRGRRARRRAREGRRHGRPQLLVLPVPATRRAAAATSSARAPRCCPRACCCSTPTGGPTRSGRCASGDASEISITSGTSASSIPSRTASSTTSTSSSGRQPDPARLHATTGGCGRSRRSASCWPRPASRARRSTGRARTRTPARATTSSRGASTRPTTRPGSPTWSGSP